MEGTTQGVFTWALLKALVAEGLQCPPQRLQQAVARTMDDVRRHFRGIEQTPMLQLARAGAAHQDGGLFDPGVRPQVPSRRAAYSDVA